MKNNQKQKQSSKVKKSSQKKITRKRMKKEQINSPIKAQGVREDGAQSPLIPAKKIPIENGVNISTTDKIPQNIPQAIPQVNTKHPEIIPTGDKVIPEAIPEIILESPETKIPEIILKSPGPDVMPEAIPEMTLENQDFLKSPDTPNNTSKSTSSSENLKTPKTSSTEIINYNESSSEEILIDQSENQVVKKSFLSEGENLDLSRESSLVTMKNLRAIASLEEKLFREPVLDETGRRRLSDIDNSFSEELFVPVHSYDIFLSRTKSMTGEKPSQDSPELFNGIFQNMLRDIQIRKVYFEKRRNSFGGKSVPLCRVSNRAPSREEPPDLSEMNIKIIRQIGEGATAKVYEGVFQQKRVAIKRVLKKNEKIFQMGINEAQILSRLSHPYIVSVLDVIERETDLILIFELYETGPVLFRQILSENKIAKILRMICIAVDHLHRQGIMHRDLKLENILVTEKSVKICDFGLATKVGKHNTICGTKHFMAPEIGSTYTEKVDVFNIGVIAYHLLKGSWTDPTHSFSIKNLGCSEKMKDFLRVSMTGDPAKRPSMDVLLKHPIFDVFLPRTDFKMDFPDFEHQTSLGRLVKNGKTLTLGPFRIDDGTFFLHKLPLQRFRILHEHLRVFNLMQKIADLYRQKYGHKFKGKPENIGPQGDLTTRSSCILPSTVYFPYNSNWFVFNPSISSQFDFLIREKRITVSNDHLIFHTQNKTEYHELNSLLSGKNRLKQDDLQLVVMALEIAEQVGKD